MEGTAMGAAQLCLQNLSLCQSWRMLPGWPKWGGSKVGRETRSQSKGAAVWFQSELALPLSPHPRPRILALPPDATNPSPELPRSFPHHPLPHSAPA